MDKTNLYNTNVLKCSKFYSREAIYALNCFSGATLGGGDEHCHPLGPALVRDEHFEPSEINP